MVVKLKRFYEENGKFLQGNLLCYFLNNDSNEILLKTVLNDPTS